MPPLKDNKAFFIHIPKTGGTSIYSLFNITYDNCSWLRKQRLHRTYSEIDRDGRFKKYKDWFFFSIIRNPWQRLVSEYYFVNRRKIGYDTENISGFKKWVFSYAESTLSKYFPPNEYIIKTPKRRARLTHLRPQYQFIYDSNMKLQINFVARFEELENDWKIISKKLGVVEDLPKKNVCKVKYHYKDYYDEELNDFVLYYYGTDIKTFKYSFD